MLLTNTENSKTKESNQFHRNLIDELNLKIIVKILDWLS